MDYLKKFENAFSGISDTSALMYYDTNLRLATARGLKLHANDSSAMVKTLRLCARYDELLYFFVVVVVDIFLFFVWWNLVFVDVIVLFLIFDCFLNISILLHQNVCMPIPEEAVGGK